MAARAPLVMNSGRTQQLRSTDSISGNGTVPTGGTTGQVLGKNSATDHDLAWLTPLIQANVLKIASLRA